MKLSVETVDQKQFLFFLVNFSKLNFFIHKCHITEQNKLSVKTTENYSRKNSTEKIMIIVCLNYGFFLQ